jgi:hypothetical protein
MYRPRVPDVGNRWADKYIVSAGPNDVEGPIRMHGMGRDCILFLLSLFIDLCTVDGNSVEYWLQTEILVLSTCVCRDRILTLG